MIGSGAVLKIANDMLGVQVKEIVSAFLKSEDGLALLREVLNAPSPAPAKVHEAGEPEKSVVNRPVKHRALGE